ncbi:UNVERIFIED_CONTAM: hypothetical protein PYX00_009977 [Menopon gallinae]|uniref:Hyaluronidase n=1 Tax=Menopon gallinae TaxID=328185 RepID=A0AAW2HD48_9NEOP
MLNISRGMGHLGILGFALFVAEISTLNPLDMVRDPNYPRTESFDVYWNIPTYLCKKHKIDFEPQVKKYGIIVNKDDAFRGEKITILYDPGMFPIVVKDTTTGKYKEVNGGIPQLGDVNRHLEEFTKVIEKVVPKDFNGLCIIDFEAWRPAFRQHWREQAIYKNMSLELVRQKHPQWNEKQIQEKAKEEFEAGAKVFMEGTLLHAKKLRPNAKWGYYGFPYCLNFGKGGSAECPDLVKKENDGIQWLFDASQAFYLSLYSSKKLTPEQHKYFVTGRLNEAWRMAIKVSKENPPKVYPYVWYRHHDDPGFLKEETMYNVLETTRKYKMGGAIIWGSSGELKTREQCQDLMNYLNTVLGPTVVKVKSN